MVNATVNEIRNHNGGIHIFGEDSKSKNVNNSNGFIEVNRAPVDLSQNKSADKGSNKDKN